MNMAEEMSHEVAAELLPWLVNNSLPDDQKHRALAHVQSCFVCRKDLADLEALHDTLTADLAVPEPPPVDMRRINRRIDAYMEKRSRIPRALDSLGAFLASPWKAAAVLQALVIGVLLVVLLVPDGEQAQFTTLADDTSLPPGNYLRLVVASSQGAGDLATLLRQFDLALVDGPSARGVATVAFPASADDERRQDVVRTLSAHPALRYVQTLTVDPQ